MGAKKYFQTEVISELKDSLVDSISKPYAEDKDWQKSLDISVEIILDEEFRYMNTGDAANQGAALHRKSNISIFSVQYNRYG